MPTQQNTDKDFQTSADTWLSGWNYRKNITITSDDDLGSDYQAFVNVTYTSHMQADFGDLRFTKTDGTTQLSYCITKKVNSSYCEVWILENYAITEVSGGSGTSYKWYNIMYYGNSAVNTTSNGDNTFIFFDNFDSQDDGDPLNTSKWAVTDQGTATVEVDTSPVTGSNAMLYYDLSDGAPVCQVTSTAWTESQNIAVDFDIYFDLLGYQWRWTVKNDGGDPNFQEYIVGTYLYDWTYRENEVTTWADFDDGTLRVTEDNFYSVELQLDATSTTGVNLLVNETDLGAGELNKADATDGFTTYNMYTHGAMSNPAKWYIDNFIVRKFVLGLDNDLTIGFGEEEYLYQENWHEINEITLIFWVAVDETGLNMLLVLLGLILVPASTFYLVYGGRKGASVDKLFIFLCVFIIGWGLILGAIFT